MHPGHDHSTTHTRLAYVLQQHISSRIPAFLDAVVLHCASVPGPLLCIYMTSHTNNGLSKADTHPSVET